MITDDTRCSPLLQSGDLAFIPPFGLIAHIHVKTKLSKISIEDAIETSITAIEAMSDTNTILPYGALFFYEHKFKILSVTNMRRFFEPFRNQIKYLLHPDRSSGFILAAGENLICVGKSAVGQTPPRLVLFDVTNLAAGAFLANIISAIQTYFAENSQRPDILRAITNIMNKPITTIEL